MIQVVKQYNISFYFYTTLCFIEFTYFISIIIIIMIQLKVSMTDFFKI